jgi:DNA polymerase-3 subunit epsilon
MVKGERINWETVLGILNTSDIVVCHNATFDRKFLEQTPIGDNFKNTLFACTKNDIDWAAREYGANKLDYLNWKLGYFYDAHRAINDCWATLNLLMQEPDAYRELLSNCQDMHEVYALNAPYAVKDILKNSGFFWSNGESKPYKAWVKLAKTDEHRDDIIEFLQDNKLASPKVITIAAKRKYSSAGE